LRILLTTALLLATTAHAQGLPPSIRTAVARSGCRFPAARYPGPADSLAAVTHLAYFAPVLTSRPSWVVVCERAGRREALVFPVGATAQSRPVARLPLQWDPVEEGCDGWIAVTDSAAVRAALRRSGAPRLRASEMRRPLHFGIVPDQCEGGTRQWYWTGERWLRLETAWEVGAGPADPPPIERDAAGDERAIARSPWRSVFFIRAFESTADS